jgi:hypothetical protein
LEGQSYPGAITCAVVMPAADLAGWPLQQVHTADGVCVGAGGDRIEVREPVRNHRAAGQCRGRCRGVCRDRSPETGRGRHVSPRCPPTTDGSQWLMVPPTGSRGLAEVIPAIAAPPVRVSGAQRCCNATASTVLVRCRLSRGRHHSTRRSDDRLRPTRTARQRRQL